jgi:hypothetical protein
MALLARESRLDMKARDGFTAVFAPDTSVDYAPEAADSSDWKASADV